MVMDSETKEEIKNMLKDLLREHAATQQEVISSMAGDEEEEDGGGEGDEVDDKYVRKLFDKDFHKEAKSFDGTPDQYNGWTFKWKNGFESLSKKFKKIVEQIETEDKEIDIKELQKKYKDVDIERWASEFYEILAKKLEGDALTTLKGVEEDRNGF